MILNSTYYRICSFSFCLQIETSWFSKIYCRTIERMCIEIFQRRYFRSYTRWHFIEWM